MAVKKKQIFLNVLSRFSHFALCTNQRGVMWNVHKWDVCTFANIVFIMQAAADGWKKQNAPDSSHFTKNDSISYDISNVEWLQVST